MLRERDMETARLYGFADHVEKFQAALYKIKGVEDVDFDLSGFLSGIPQVIFLPKYNVPVAAPDYFEQRRALLAEIIRVAAEFGMTRTEDRIEDYGEHWYIVTRLAAEHYSKSIRDHIKVEGHRGTWYAIDESWARLTPGDGGKPRTAYAHVLLLEHETYGDEAACVIIDEGGTLLLEDVYNGFDDLEEAGWEIISEAEYTSHQPTEPKRSLSPAP